jgi:outer membrane murein-binding lipoprotein Lpp
MIEAAIIGASNLLGLVIAGIAIRNPLKQAAAAAKTLTAAIDRFTKEVDDLELTIRNVQAATVDMRRRERGKHGSV